MHRRVSATAGVALALALAACGSSPSPSAPPSTLAASTAPSPAPSSSLAASPSEVAVSSSPSPSAQAAFALTSPAFAANAAIPRTFTCDGQDTSPPLAWSGVPAGAASLAVLVTDPDARDFVHWAAWAIDPASGRLAQGASAGSGLTEGRNSFGKIGYGGPCPPSGTHHYVFELVALDQAPSLQRGATADQLRSAIKAHTIATTRLTATYKRG